MPKNKDEINFLIPKITYSYTWCRLCEGSGKKSHTFKGTVFNEPCRHCKGTGRERLEQRTEVPLLEALKELSIIK